jgi:membrane associated rhomboid family serine protease
VVALEPMTDVQQGQTTCYRHPNRSTGLHCTRCGRPACHECLRPAPVGSHCLECLREGKQVVVRAPWQGGAAGRAGPGASLIIAACVAVFLLQVVQPDLEARFSMVGALVAGPGAEWYRLVTSMFLHFGLMHLAMNMLAVWIYGLEVERAEGSVRTVGAFLATGLVGGAAAFLWHSPFATVAGASGGVFGLLGVALILTVRAGRPAQPLLGLLAVNLVIGLVVPNISLAAHAGGFVAGVAYGAVTTLPRRAQPFVLSIVTLLALVGLAAAVVTTMDPGQLAG